jgi:hypothetical protein
MVGDSSQHPECTVENAQRRPDAPPNLSSFSRSGLDGNPFSPHIKRSPPETGVIPALALSAPVF